MKLQKGTIQELSRLARLVIDTLTAASGIHEVHPLPTTPREFYDLHWPLFYAMLKVLSRDGAVTNRSHVEIQGDLWAFLEDLMQDPVSYTERKTLNARVNRFVEELTRKTEEYEVGFAIEGFLLPEGEITIGRTTFLHFDAERARIWGILSERASGFSSRVIGGAIGLVRVQAGSFDKAWELAAQEVDTSLSIMRVAMASAQEAPSRDDLFLQQRGSYYVAKRITGEAELVAGMRRGFSRVNLDLREQLKKLRGPLIGAASDIGERAAALYDNSLPSQLSQALLRALEWAGSSVTRESYDDKVVDLCTAMECMLSVKSDRLKGEAIALRYIVLTSLTSSLYIRPSAILPIYRLRSEVIHGARRRAAMQAHYTAMREVVMVTFSMVLDLVKTNKDIRDVKGLIDFLEGNKERIERVLMILDGEELRDDRAVEKYARSVIERIRTT